MVLFLLCFLLQHLTTVDWDILSSNKFCQDHCGTKKNIHTLTVVFKHTHANFTKLKLVKYFAHASLLPMKYSQSMVF